MSEDDIVFFFFNDTATTEIYTLSLHDALPIFNVSREGVGQLGREAAAPALAQLHHHRVVPGVAVRGLQLDGREGRVGPRLPRDRKSTRLNSSHANISYAVFCLKKKQLIFCLYI